MTTIARFGVAASLILVSNLVVAAPPTDQPTYRRSEWMGFERYDFQVGGRDCLVVIPKEAAAGRPWAWRTEFFGHEPQGDVALLKHGFHITYLNVQNMYGAPVALDHMDRFYEHVVREASGGGGEGSGPQLGLAKKVVLEGFSRGGLFAFNWAARHPERVAAIYADAPVCDFKSWPAAFPPSRGKGSPADWERCKQAYGFKSDEEARAYRLNPIDNLAPLAAAKVRLIHVCGDADDVVPFPENSALIERRYRELGGPIQMIVKPGVGHHPHSLVDPTPIVEFLLESVKTPRS